jgi:hypothetical protein
VAQDIATGLHRFKENFYKRKRDDEYGENTNNSADDGLSKKRPGTKEEEDVAQVAHRAGASDDDLLHENSDC